MGSLGAPLLCRDRLTGTPETRHSWSGSIYYLRNLTLLWVQAGHGLDMIAIEQCMLLYVPAFASVRNDAFPATFHVFKHSSQFLALA